VTPTNHRFLAYWTREDDAFAQSWDYETAGPLWANPLFSLLEDLVAKAARDGCLMLIIAPEWPGPQYPCWAALSALCPKPWQLPQDPPLYLRGGVWGTVSPCLSQTGCGCLQSLISHLRSVHLSAGSSPPDAWLRARNLRVCLA